MERLDKAFSSCKIKSRSQIAKLIKQRKVMVNGVVVTDPTFKVDVVSDEILLEGEKVVFNKYVYVMLNKPQGVISASTDGSEKTVIDILPSEYKRNGLFPCGRLDKNTLGLILITDNGDLAHELLSPRSHVSKSYRFKAAEPISEEAAMQFEKGVTLADGYVTMPAKIELTGNGDEGIITLKEGKYHQIKRMLGALNNKIIYLERVTFGPLTLDESLERGAWRFLTDEEIENLKQHKTKIGGV